MRHVFRGHVMSAQPMVVVAEDDERVVLYQRVGTMGSWLREGRLPQWIEAGYPTELRPWADNDVLHIIPKGRAHSIYFMREHETGNEVCWYVNLQDPVRATGLGWDTWDHELDVVAWPDCSAWWWKDEAEFDERVSLGLVDDPDAVRAEGLAVIADIEARRRPFDEPWRTWLPDPSWPIPSLPDGWDVVSG